MWWSLSEKTVLCGGHELPLNQRYQNVLGHGFSNICMYENHLEILFSAGSGAGLGGDRDSAFLTSSQEKLRLPFCWSRDLKRINTAGI